MTLNDIINGARLLFAPNCPVCNEGKLLPYIDSQKPDDPLFWGVECLGCGVLYNRDRKNLLAGQTIDPFMGMNKHPQQTKHQFRIELLMHCAKHAVPLVPFLPDKKVRKLRAKLILEEALETIDNLGFDVWDSRNLVPHDTAITMENLQFIPNGRENLVGIADGCADVSVVTIGTLSACGIKDNSLLEEVDGNNLMKFGPEAIANGAGYNEDGKWCKPKNHPKPNIERVLHGQGM